MFNTKLVATLAVVTASALLPAAATAATPAAPGAGADRAVAAAPGTQVGSEGVRAQPGPDGIIAILIGLR